MSRTLMGITHNYQAWLLDRHLHSHNALLDTIYQAAYHLCRLVDHLAIGLRCGRWIYTYPFQRFPYDPSFKPPWSVRVKKWVTYKPYLYLIHQHKVLVFLNDAPYVIQAIYRNREDSSKLIGKITNHGAQIENPIPLGRWVYFDTTNVHPTSL